MRSAFVGLIVLVWLTAACAAGGGPGTRGSAPAEPAWPASASGGSAGAAPAGGAAAPAAEPTVAALGRVRASFPIVSTGIAPLWLADEAGLWKKHGLDVELMLISGTPPSVAALIAGEVQFIAAAGESGLQAQTRNPDLVGIANYSMTQPQRLIARPEIHRFEDLKGKRIGVFTIGDGHYTQWGKALSRVGLNPERDVTWIAVGGGNQGAFIAALSADSIDAALLLPPNDLPALKNGMHVLAEMADLNLPHPGLPTYTLRRTLETQRPIAEAYVKGIVDGVRLFKSDPQYAKEVLARRTGIGDPEAIDAAYNAYRGERLGERPFIDFDKMRAAIVDVAFENPDVAELQVERAYDNSVVQALEAQGYLAPRP
jgi:NitT/TauT family transport system substrate-binding protein